MYTPPRSQPFSQGLRNGVAPAHWRRPLTQGREIIDTPRLDYWRKLKEGDSRRKEREAAMNADRFRGGMQVHAVPEAERAFDASGTRLPWAYEFADPAPGRRQPQESGPFGRSSSRRTGTRSKTQTPARTQSDRDTAENWRAIDDIFSRVKEQDGAAQEKNVATESSSAGAAPLALKAGEPTEVILYGFPPVFQYAAIEYYERVSQGRIYEDYERSPPNSRYNTTLSQMRARSSQNLTADALRKRNNYSGGEHWIKVTYDSEDAADRACYASPHIINGYLVHAELYRGAGPQIDQAIPATEAAVRSVTASPASKATSGTLQQGSLNSSMTASSATMRGGGQGYSASFSSSSSNTAAKPSSLEMQQLNTRQYQQQPDDATSSALSPTTPALQSQYPSSSSDPTPPETQSQITHRPLRIKGAKRAVLLPASQALLPSQTKFQKTVRALPVVSWFFGSGGSQGGLVGDTVPRTDAGEFDWAAASLYWRFWWYVDHVFGTGISGVKED